MKRSINIYCDHQAKGCVAGTRQVVRALEPQVHVPEGRGELRTGSARWHNGSGEEGHLSQSWGGREVFLKKITIIKTKTQRMSEQELTRGR